MNPHFKWGFVIYNRFITTPKIVTICYNILFGSYTESVINYDSKRKEQQQNE